ncbi:MAG: hypothetical protein IPO90_17385 [Flavobacteriales bacterium]|nr:hypothetical protein [Flavobacteriales bacterium]
MGCNLEVKVKDNKVVAITAPYDAESNQGHTCLKGRYAFHFYELHPGATAHAAHPRTTANSFPRHGMKPTPLSWTASPTSWRSTAPSRSPV